MKLKLESRLSKSPRQTGNACSLLLLTSHSFRLEIAGRAHTFLSGKVSTRLLPSTSSLSSLNLCITLKAVGQRSE
jgi:hypothetical protein